MSGRAPGSSPDGPRHKRPTRDDVAALAGVSSAVVSYVINDGPRPVSAAARARVLDAIGRLDYVPNQAARSLAGQRTRTLGLIAPTLTNPVWSGLALGVNDVALPASFLLMVCDVEHDPGLDVHYAATLASKQVDGVILVPTADPDETLEVLHRSRVPTVVVERTTPSAPSVTVDPDATGRLVTEHLLGLGHRRIAFVREHGSNLDSRHRLRGFRAAMDESGVVVDERLVVDTGPNVDDSVVEGARRAAESLFDLDRPPTAVFAHNDLIAIAVVRAARSSGLRVPEDVSVVGVDDIEAGRYVDPPLTTVPFPSRELGRTAAQVVLDALAGSEPSASTVLPPNELLIRASTAPPATAGEEYGRSGTVRPVAPRPRRDPAMRGGLDDDERDDR